MPSISRDHGAHVARLARLELTADELELFTSQLAAVLDHAADVEALAVADGPPTMHPYPLRNVTRSDEIRPGVDRDEVLAQAPSAEDGRFKVPRILGEEPGRPQRSPTPSAPSSAPRLRCSTSPSHGCARGKPRSTRSTS